MVRAPTPPLPLRRRGAKATRCQQPLSCAAGEGGAQRRGEGPALAPHPQPRPPHNTLTPTPLPLRRRGAPAPRCDNPLQHATTGPAMSHRNDPSRKISPPRGTEPHPTYWLTAEIGTEQLRERMGQSIENTLDAIPLKKKIKTK